MKKNNIIFFVILVLIFLIFDFIYTRKFDKNIKSLIFTKNQFFHHHLLPNKFSIDGGGMKFPEYKIFTNSLGFRDSKIRQIVKKKKNRIIFIGDSFVFGTLLDYEFTVVGLVDKYFKNKIEVLNAGVSSYSPSIYYNKVKFFLEKGLKFSHLVVFIDISDIEDEAIIYEADKKTGYIKYTDEVIKLQISEKILLKTSQNFLTNVKQLLKENLSITYRSVIYLASKFMLITLKMTNKEFINYIVSEKFTRDKWTINEDIKKKYDMGIKKSIFYMSLLKNLLDKNEIKMTIVVYPWFTQIYHNDLNSIQVQIWEEFSKKNDIQFINLFPVFISNENKNLNIYQKIMLDFIPLDIHWNKNGSEKVFKYFIENFKY
jgi:hypothetical protein